MRHIPNILSSLNLFCGCIAIVWIFHNHLEWAAYIVMLAAFFDLLDGMAARMLNVLSPFGKQLDSLADVVTFGLVPASIMFQLAKESGLHEAVGIGDVQYFPFIITI